MFQLETHSVMALFSSHASVPVVKLDGVSTDRLLVKSGSHFTAYPAIPRIQESTP